MFTKINFSAAIAIIFTAVSVWVQDGDRIKIETNLISVPVVVSDRDGRYVPNLTARDFTVYQDGQAQPIDFFAATEEPLTIALLIDTSHSTRPVLSDIKDSADSFIKLLQPRDRAMIVSFNYDIQVLSPLTSSHEQLKRAVGDAEIPRDAGTLLRDAAYETITRTLAPIKGRKAVIILTDGKDAGSSISSSELLYALQETDTLVYTIMFKTGGQRRPPIFNGGGGGNGGIFGGGRGRGFPMPRPRRDDPRRQARVEEKNEEAGEFLQRLADATAGRSYSSNDGKLKTTFASIVEELRYQYRLGFYPPDSTDTSVVHQLRVRVARPNVAVRTRDSYRIAGKQN